MELVLIVIAMFLLFKIVSKITRVAFKVLSVIIGLIAVARLYTMLQML